PFASLKMLRLFISSFLKRRFVWREAYIIKKARHSFSSLVWRRGVNLALCSYEGKHGGTWGEVSLF
ncbi:hypothetical protein CUPS4066_09995, partial [Campylobacter upsaliensis]|uniref:hypothetical protein n=1 Tax=Campylobacter upsaliensis TaxID=28080 RepID=UPI00214A2D4E